MRVVLGAIYPFAFMLLFLIIPFDDYVRALPNILLVILGATFPFIIKKEDFQKIHKTPFLICIGFFLYVSINSLVNDRFMEDLSVIKKIGMSLALLILYLPIEFDRNIQKAVIYSSFAAILFSIGSIVYASNTNPTFEFGDTQTMLEALLVDRLYLGLLSILSIIFCYHSMRKKYHPHNVYYLAGILVNIVFIFLIVSKIAIVVLLLIALLRLLYGNKKFISVPIFFLVCAAITGYGFIKFQQQRELTPKASFNEIVEEVIYGTQTFEIRLITWDCSLDVLYNATNKWTGIGFQNTKQQLLDCYDSEIQEDEIKSRFVTEKYNSHNQFLDILISAGLIGLLLFIVFILYAGFLNKKHYTAIAILLTLILYCSVENVFHRQIGGYYVGLLFIILLKNYNHKEIDSPKEV